MVTYSAAYTELGEYIRDRIRNSSDIQTLLSISSDNMKNFVFYTRPVKQKDGFTPPRIVIENTPSTIGNLGYEGIGQPTGQYGFQILAWVNASPYSLSTQLMQYLIALFNGHQISINEGTKYGNLSFEIDSFSHNRDPDKDTLNQITISVNAQINGE